MPPASWFEILGPLAIRRGDQVIRLGSPQQRRVLAVLLITDRSVTADELIDALWGETPPPTVAGTLQTHISRLRTALGGGSALLPHDAGGYRLEVDDDQVDARRFRALVEQSSAAGDSGDERRARDLLAEALSLWSGPALQDFRYEPFAQAEIARLEGQRISALERRIGLDLALGGDAELPGELEALTEEYPLREELHGLLMVALYRSGRQADALAVYRRLRETLVDELGVEPTAKVRALERDILDHAPTLMPPAAATPPVPVGVRGPSPDALHPWLQSLEVPALDPKTRCELLLARGEGQRRSGNELEARHTYAAAVRLASASGSAEQLADGALGFAGPPEDTVLGEPLDEALLERAIRALPEHRPVVAMLRARLAVALIDRGDARGNEMADNAIAFARSAGNTAALAYALRARHRTWFDPLALQQRLALGTELIELGQQLGEPEVLAWGHRWHATDILETGDLNAFAAENDKLEVLAARLHDAFHWWGVIIRRAGVALTQGPPAKAEPLVMEALGLAGQIQSPYTLAASALAFCVLRWHQGRLEELRDTILDGDDVGPHAVLIPYLYKELGQKAEAAAAYQRFAADDFVELLGRDTTRVSHLFALTALTDLAWYLRDRDRAQPLHDLLSPLAGQWAVVNPGITLIAPIHHLLGQLEALMGDRRGADAHFERALAQCHESNAPTLAVRTQIAYAEMLQELGDRTDRTRAQELLASARQTADELGLEGVVRRIDAE